MKPLYYKVVISSSFATAFFRARIIPLNGVAASGTHWLLRNGAYATVAKPHVQIRFTLAILYGAG
jgi:hypothetical protein